ncbi:hypothetical protein GGR56DRAFT_397369 [Xylariaceae sp. FL0804]|nr:hypothetical protein GGR56DRAFT_397369 [Xylariaceae sp. FL0804]
MSGEPEPRRSVRATKGQHTKAFDQLENGPEPPKRRQTKKNAKKAAEKEDKQEEEAEELIRCICGATTQDEGDEDEPWIACDKCAAWQHNVCMGMSIYSEDLPKEYFCEQCAPDDHKLTLEAIEKGEKPWEDRHRQYEENKKGKKGGRKGKGKRVSDPKERASPSTSSAKPKASPTPDTKKEDTGTDTPVKGKRKSHDHSQGPASKLRKVAEAKPERTYPEYTPPEDLPDSIQKLDGSRKSAAQALQKSLDLAIDQSEKKKLYQVPQGSAKTLVSERLAIEIERAWYDNRHQPWSSASQLRALIFGLKKNLDIAVLVLNRELPPTSFACMTGDELATKELQDQNAEMKARAEKQSILITDDGPRMRRTHKGEEFVESDSFAMGADEAPSNLRQKSIQEAADGGAVGSSTIERESPSNARRASSGPLRVDTQRQPPQKPSDFDIGKVFSSVRSPSTPHQRRASTQVRSAGPGEDPDVDRLLQDDGNDSPPYSPTEDVDPDVVWRGPLGMTNVADITTVAKYVGGADLSKVRGIPWKDLIPPLLTVAGRIPEEKAVPYLCGLRYNNQIDLVITSLSPAHPQDENARKQFLAVIDYFRSKKRYGVVGERKLGNVRDTYLVPVPEGDGPIPEPMQNIGDHLIPQIRPEPMLLMVFVVRDEKQNPVPVDQHKADASRTTAASPAQKTPVPPPRNPSMSGPAWSPATPQGNTPSNKQSIPVQQQYSHTPIPPPRIPGQPAPPMQPRPVAAATPTATPATTPAIAGPGAPNSNNYDENDPAVIAHLAALAEGQKKAYDILGPLYYTTPSVQFLLPHANRMMAGEWAVVRKVLEREPKAHHDLQTLSKLLTDEGTASKNNGRPPQANFAPTAVAQTTLAAATANAASTGAAQPPLAAAATANTPGPQQG